ncbi:MAG: hypothetical protein ABGY96_05590 [bacterium]|nr:hypothetical protein [Gammaproteobacteria bacterium]HIL96865.1 hypothetical protein [Pseudomonadales bacterium]
MKFRIIALLCCALFVTPVLANDAIVTMASVLVKLNHFPTEADKQALSKIVDDKASDETDKQLAEIISGIAHRVSDKDKEILRGMLFNEDLSDDTKAIAKTILGIEHHPKDADVEAMKKIIEDAG